ncbi:MAG: hypothetical protein DMD81_08705 [Candidatus Rokuibacteriota bacterium]|nr:MAG: hypothetical protein DMD81_08705 [Candidatus Rokubacteria bacterium]
MTSEPPGSVAGRHVTGRRERVAGEAVPDRATPAQRQASLRRNGTFAEAATLASLDGSREPARTRSQRPVTRRPAPRALD